MTALVPLFQHAPLHDQHDQRGLLLCCVDFDGWGWHAINQSTVCGVGWWIGAGRHLRPHPHSPACHRPAALHGCGGPSVSGKTRREVKRNAGRCWERKGGKVGGRGALLAPSTKASPWPPWLPYSFLPSWFYFVPFGHAGTMWAVCGWFFGWKRAVCPGGLCRLWPHRVSCWLCGL